MAELNIYERQVDDVTILDLNGDIIFGQGNVTLRIAIRRLLNKGNKKILLNFSGVKLADSSGIGELASAFIAADREGGQLKLLNLTQKIQYLLEITKLSRVFDIYKNEAEAIESFDQVVSFLRS
jgi:anti-sigma B factor antagonist